MSADKPKREARVCLFFCKPMERKREKRVLCIFVVVINTIPFYHNTARFILSEFMIMSDESVTAINIIIFFHIFIVE